MDNHVKLLSEIARRIEKNPELFSMRNWFGQGLCGTTACIAGWAITLALGKEKPEWIVPTDFKPMAMELLKLNDAQATALFYADRWPYPFNDKWFASLSVNERAQIACDRIRHFIETGE